MARRGSFIRFLIGFAIILTVLAILGAAVYLVLSKYAIKTVYVDGNVHYTEEEIKAFVMDGMLGDNSLYLSMKYKNKGIENVPFVDAMDVSVLAPDTIRITVYEKALAGYVECMGTYVYFDKDGYAVESSGIRTAGVPQVTGLSFDHVVLGEPLPVQEGFADVFGTILNLTKLLQKYKLTADKINFQKNANISIYFGDVRVALGNEAEHLEDKLMLLPEILPNLKGENGVFQMETYKEKGGYMFKPN